MENQNRKMFLATVSVWIVLIVVICGMACVIDDQQTEITKLRKEAMKRGYACWVDAHGKAEFKWKE